MTSSAERGANVTLGQILDAVLDVKGEVASSRTSITDLGDRMDRMDRNLDGVCSFMRELDTRTTRVEEQVATVKSEQIRRETRCSKEFHEIQTALGQATGTERLELNKLIKQSERLHGKWDLLRVMAAILLGAMAFLGGAVGFYISCSKVVAPAAAVKSDGARRPASDKIPPLEGIPAPKH